MAVDGLQNIFQDIIQNPNSITSAFDVVKNTFNELMLLLYYFYFFFVYILYVVIALGLFVVLPIYLLKQYTQNKRYIDDILFLRTGRIRSTQK